MDNYADKNFKQSRENKGNSIIDFPTNYCVIDLETTGLVSDYDEIIEMSAIKIKNNMIVDKFSSLANIGDIKLDEYITELTGITTEMLAEAPYLDSVLTDFLNFVGDDIVIGHNVNFDINFIYDDSIILFDRIFNNDFVDTLRLARKLLPDLPKHKLSYVAEHYNVDYSQAHRAMADCEITYKCYLELKKEAIKQYGSLDDFKNSFKRRKNQFKIREITTSNTEFDTTNPLYGKICVFTGKLDKMRRTDAAQLVVDLGGICADGITKKTDYLILGNTEYSNNVKDGKTNKFKKAQSLILKGSDLEIITENLFYEFISMLDYKDNETNNPDISNCPEIIELSSLEDKENLLKEYKFTTRDISRNIKPLYYKGIETNGKPVVCSLLGYIITNNHKTFVIEVNNKRINICPDYLKEMQDNNFLLKFGGKAE